MSIAATELVRAETRVRDEIARVNAAARALLAQLSPFMSSKAETVLDGDMDALARWYVQLGDARERLHAADVDLHQLRRSIA
ncbi:MAG: hypothetical protein U1A27_00140 [Phycisphaerae bacterium]